jgi:hypothetical protein
MTGINATKIIRNLEFVNSFGLSSLAFFLFWIFHFAIWVRSIPPTPARGEGRWPKASFASSTQPSSRTGSLCLPVWSMAPLPLCNACHFPQLGPHWSGQSNCLQPQSLGRGLQFRNWAIPIGALVQCKSIPQYNEANSISRIGQGSRD